MFLLVYSLREPDPSEALELFPSQLVTKYLKLNIIILNLKVEIFKLLQLKAARERILCGCI